MTLPPSLTSATSLLFEGAASTGTLTLTGCADLIFRGCSLDRLTLTNCHNLTFEACDFAPTGPGNVVFAAGGSYNTFRGCQIHGSAAYGSGRGLWLGNTPAGDDELYVTVEDCTLWDIGATAIVVGDCGSLVRRNTVHDVAGAGVVLYPSQSGIGADILGNTLLRCGYHCLQSDCVEPGKKTRNVRAIGNVLSRAKHCGAYLYHVDHWTFRDNAAEDNADAGALLSDATACRIYGGSYNRNGVGILVDGGPCDDLGIYDPVTSHNTYWGVGVRTVNPAPITGVRVARVRGEGNGLELVKAWPMNGGPVPGVVVG